MAKRHKIVASQLKKYSVAEDIDEILDRLSFREFSPSQVPGWKMFTRKSEGDDFAAIYGEREFLVEGPYSSIEVPQRDLENITKYVFNESWVSRKIRDRTPAPALAVPFAVMTITVYDMLNKNIDILEGINTCIKSVYPSARESDVALLFLGGVLGGMLAAGTAVAAAESILNRYYGSKLSKEAENYNYGITAEIRLRSEYIFEKIRSGEIGKNYFLNFLNQS